MLPKEFVLVDSFFPKPIEPWRNCPGWLRDKIEPTLEAEEVILAWAEFDLDQNLHYSQTWVGLSDRRLLSAQPTADAAEGEPASVKNIPIQSWPLRESLVLRIHEGGGVGTLELVGPAERITQWCFTIGKSAAAKRIVDRWTLWRRTHEADGRKITEVEVLTCPKCGAELLPEQPCPECSEPGAAQAKTLFRLLRFAKNRAGVALFGVFLAVAATAAALVPPYLTMPLLDKVLIPFQNGKPANLRLVPIFLGGFALASLLAWALGWARTYVLAWATERLSADLRVATYEHLHKLSLEFFSTQRTGDLISRVSSDTDRICYFLSVYVLDFGSDVLMIVMTAGILLSIDPLLAIVTLCPLPVIAYLVHRVRNRLRTGFHAGSTAWAEMTSILADTIPGIRVVKAFAQEHREIDRFRCSNDRVLAANDRVNTLWAFFGPMVTLLTDMGLLVVWVCGVWRVFHEHITVGVLTLFLTYISRFYARLDSMSRMVSAVQRAAASTQRIFEILDRIPSVAEPLQPVHPGRLRGEIELRDISFHYGNRSIIDGLSLKIAEGEMIGLVGPSGAGKTTLVNLVCRFYDVTEGAILVDGVDIRRFPVQEYRRHVGLVLQEPFLFYGTIAENIAYGRPDAEREEIIAAARAARAHEFILRLPDGYDSMVGERGQSLSGGERQRISIARAILIDPRILILDEATSSVDTETEREIQLALENLIRGRTTIAIAHRLSTLRRADRLVVLERGEITETGRHDELVDATGTYARLYRAQLEMSAGEPLASPES